MASLRYLLWCDDGNERWTFESDNHADIARRVEAAARYGETTGPAYYRADVVEKLRDALLDVRTWARNLTPEDGIKYGSYWPEYAVREALKLIPPKVSAGDREGE